jgi:hypothetical protein
VEKMCLLVESQREEGEHLFIWIILQISESRLCSVEWCYRKGSEFATSLEGC